jgi:tetrahydromethanopterin S-methyltransferase subunit F
VFLSFIDNSNSALKSGTNVARKTGITKGFSGKILLAKTLVMSQ